jgi:hypothetical protein
MVVPRIAVASIPLRSEGRTVRLKAWLAEKERSTWIAAIEIVVVGLILIMAPGSEVGRIVAVALLAHLGYTALAGLPVRASKREAEVEPTPERAQSQLQEHVVRFVNEVRRVEAYTDHTRDSGVSRSEVEKNLRAAQREMMDAAAEVMQLTGAARRPAEDGDQGSEDKRLVVA